MQRERSSFGGFSKKAFAKEQKIVFHLKIRQWTNGKNKKNEKLVNQ